jgi:methionine-R-sulfoxide reductase
MKIVLILIALSVGVGALFAYNSTAGSNLQDSGGRSSNVEIGQDGTKKILGWKIEKGRFAEGPYKGFLCESPKRDDKFVKTDAEWRKILTPEQYKILRGHGTEAAFCGAFYDNHKDGFYRVAGSGQPVFKSDAKFDSGTGWPSFFQPYDMDAIWLKADTSYGMVRMEVLATRCDGHLGHVFEDGPGDKGGLRFCINSEALTFEEKK